jgi:cbb3-type cytochrome oxidase subunit 3
MFKNLVDFSWNAPLAAAVTVVFFVLFIAVIVWTMFLKKKYIRKMENLPLQSDEETTTAHKEQE